MGVFGAFFGCRGDVGFNVAMLSRLVREKVRPAWSDGGREREIVRPAYEKWVKIGVLWRAGRVFSRKRGWRGGARRVFSRISSRVILLGELCRAVALVAGPSTGSVNPSMRS